MLQAGCDLPTISRSWLSGRYPAAAGISLMHAGLSSGFTSAPGGRKLDR